MSAFLSVETEFEDVGCIVEALKSLGLRQDQIEVHETPAPLRGYVGDVREQKASVVVRKKHLALDSNDMGFYKTPKGTYALWLSEYDETAVPAHFRCRNKDQFVGKLKQGYAEAKVLKSASKGNWQVQKARQGGKVVLKLSKYV